MRSISPAAPARSAIARERTSPRPDPHRQGPGRSPRPRVPAKEVEKPEPRGADHVFDVRYSARADTFVVRSRWRKLEGGWMVVHAERLWTEGEKRPGIVSRLLGSVLRTLAGLRRR